MFGVVGVICEYSANIQYSYKYKKKALESATIESDSLVFEYIYNCIYYFLSRIRHVESGLNLGGPPSKPKQCSRSIVN